MKGVAAWNAWREKSLTINPDLSGANLSYANLSYANLVGTNLRGANLRGSDNTAGKHSPTRAFPD